MNYEITSQGQKIRIYERLECLKALIKVLIMLMVIQTVLALAGFFIIFGNLADRAIVDKDIMDKLNEISVSIDPEDTTSWFDKDTVPDFFDDVLIMPDKIEPISLGTFSITHYCSCKACCGKWADGITATGSKAKEAHTVAVDPEVIPLGSEVIVEGKTYIAEDTGSKIKGNRIDIYVDSHKKALQMGVKKAEVYLKK